MKALRDKTGREIKVGDVLKVFHFVGARRKRYYMYKQVIDTTALGGKQKDHLKISHLDLTDDYYTEFLDGRLMQNIEIVDSAECDHHDRPRITDQ